MSSIYVLCHVSSLEMDHIYKYFVVLCGSLTCHQVLYPLLEPFPHRHAHTLQIYRQGIRSRGVILWAFTLEMENITKLLSTCFNTALVLACPEVMTLGDVWLLFCFSLQITQLWIRCWRCSRESWSLLWMR